MRSLKLKCFGTKIQPGVHKLLKKELRKYLFLFYVGES